MMNLVVERPTVSGPPPVHLAAAASGTSPGHDVLPTGFADLWQALAGLRNPRALAVVLGGSIAGVLLQRFLSTLGGHSGLLLSALGMLALFMAFATGVNAAGLLLMAQAKRLPQPELQAAILFGLKCVPRLVVLWGALLLLGLVVVSLMALAYSVCRLPVVGPVLLVAVFPVTVIVSGVCLSGLALGLVLVMPSVWEGASIPVAMAAVLAIARDRLVESLLLLTTLALLTLAVAGAVFGVVWTGMVSMLAVASRVVGDGTFPGLSDILRAAVDLGLQGRPAVDGNATATVIGAGLVSSFAASSVSTVWLLGLTLIYLRLAEGVESDALEQTQKHLGAEVTGGSASIAVPLSRAADDRADQRRKTASGQAAALRELAAAAPAPTPDDDETVGFATARKCSHCFSAVQSDDVFCEICGYKLG